MSTYFWLDTMEKGKLNLEPKFPGVCVRNMVDLYVDFRVFTQNILRHQHRTPHKKSAYYSFPAGPTKLPVSYSLVNERV